MELFYFCCLISICVICGITFSHHKKSEAALMDAVAKNAETSAKHEKRLKELEDKFNELLEAGANMDAAEFEKRWQDGVQSIMNYSLMAAMGGKHE